MKGLSYIEYVTKFDEIILRLRQVQYEVEPLLMREVFVMNLNKTKFEAAWATLMNFDEETTTLKDIRDYLDKYNRDRNSREDKTKENYSLVSINVTCDNCGRHGHKAADCFKPRDEDRIRKNRTNRTRKHEEKENDDESQDDESLDDADIKSFDGDGSDGDTRTTAKKSGCQWCGKFHSGTCRKLIKAYEESSKKKKW
jgi:hypothetical protein